MSISENLATLLRAEPEGRTFGRCDVVIDWVVDTNAAESKYMSVLIQSPLDFILMWLQIGFLLLALR